MLWEESEGMVGGDAEGKVPPGHLVGDAAEKLLKSV